MGQKKKVFECEECGFQSPNWMGRCSSCGNWNTFKEYYQEKKGSKKRKTISDSLQAEPQPLTEIGEGIQERLSSGISEFDRVLGGGLVEGSLILLGGAPGIGKSTLILQVAFLFSQRNNRILYIAGEESKKQLALRAERIEACHENIDILATTSYHRAAEVSNTRDFDLVIVDSIQTIYDNELDSSPGSIVQVREMTANFLQFAKESGVAVILIGHVTKEGQLAGPRVMEHMVDTVLYLEGDNSNNHRLLRASKNRFGSIEEVGVFAMGSSGLKEIKNPSSLFLRERPPDSSGSVVVPVSEGSRVILVEVQVLVTSSTFGNVQRITSGVDKGRANLLLAVLEKHLGLNFQDRDIHFNVVGGLQVSEPALDLALAAATISSYFDLVLPTDLALCGEVGLSGEVRSVSNLKSRLQEAEKMDFSTFILPAGNYQEEMNKFSLDLAPIKKIVELEKFLKQLASK